MLSTRQKQCEKKREEKKQQVMTIATNVPEGKSHDHIEVASAGSFPIFLQWSLSDNKWFVEGKVTQINKYCNSVHCIMSMLSELLPGQTKQKMWFTLE